MPRDLLKDCSCDLELLFDRLIRISCSPQRDVFARLDFAQFLPEQVSRVLLGVDLLFELNPVAHLHKLMRITRITIFAGKLAPAVRIYCPGKRHTPARAAI